MWFSGVEVEQEKSAPPPKKNPGSAPAITIVLFRRVEEFYFVTISLLLLL